MDDVSYTIEEVAHLLKVSKLTVYNLIKKGKLPAYRVGRQMRVDAADLESYKKVTRGTDRSEAGQAVGLTQNLDSQPRQPSRSIIISGQDMCLDILAGHIGRQTEQYRPLRAYKGSLNSLIDMYRGEADIVSTHLFDGDTGGYNTPYVSKILVGHRYMIVNLVSRQAGFYVRKGNPMQVRSWADLSKPGIKIINREKGSGARILLDEQLRVHHIAVQNINGYEREESNHLGVAGVIASGEADVGIGIEKAAYIVGVEFIPLVEERYDLVLLKTPQNSELIPLIIGILRSSAFQNEIQSIGGYNLTQTGKILYETW